MRSSPFALPDRLIATPAEKRVAFLRGRSFAHRGLHGAGVIENSRAAFRAAIAVGHGIECDVQAAQGGEAFVFHDDTLDRLTGESGALADRAAATLDTVALSGTDEMLPRLTEMLALVSGRVPLLIEVKAGHGGIGPLCVSVRRALEGYRGPVAVMSFNPEVGRWFADHAPRLTRGLVVSEQGKPRLRGTAERWLSLWRARPDFLAYDVRDLPSRFAARARRRDMPVLTWTVRDAAAEARATAHADAPIYERP
ncbi:glycerophosphodiester phosphodiesterase family protein [Sphingomonas solaris]|uniref:Glycerophosphodiester phosphodiesterase n=1 Tax=Alterirhizorhabdus solaris TaxID=2529389 RepID=A0A558R9T7_9SPHN|nr:glycerophosphodiester phosphodiesterase family protein [Sphingomonas solaris]TVV76153.1 glycerophosphodiester phosphodiesterase [Sphingomonas solaris]